MSYELPCVRVARIRCETPKEFREMRALCANSPVTAGARVGALGEFLITNEERFRVTKNAYGAREYDY